MNTITTTVSNMQERALENILCDQSHETGAHETNGHNEKGRRIKKISPRTKYIFLFYMKTLLFLIF